MVLWTRKTRNLNLTQEILILKVGVEKKKNSTLVKIPNGSDLKFDFSHLINSLQIAEGHVSVLQDKITA
jgi:hypothetical protein